MSFKDRIKELIRVPAGDLLPNPKNWRQHPEKQRSALSGVLSEVGWADAVLARETSDGLMLIDGHLRTEVAPDSEIPVLVLDVSEDEADKILLTHDPLADMAETNAAALDSLMRDVNTGSEGVQEMLAELADSAGLYPEITEQSVTEDEVPEPPKKAITKAGDIWQLGSHRLMCGDSTSSEDVGRLLNNKTATLLHADPPYGMGKENEGIANDNLYREKLDAFQMEWWRAWRPSLADNGSAYIWGNSPDLWRLWYCGGLADSERLTVRNEIAWHKGGGGLAVGTEAGRMFQSSERCLFFMLGEQGFNINAENFWEGWEALRLYLKNELKKVGNIKWAKRVAGHSETSGCHWFDASQWTMPTREVYESWRSEAEGRAFRRRYDELKKDYDELKKDYDELKKEFYETRAFFDNAHDNMTDVWEFNRVTGEERHGHATPKPVAMCARVMLSSSRCEDVVLVPFGGSGPEFIAAEQLGRECYGMEISPQYCDVIIERWQNLTGQKAKKVTDGT